MHQKMLLVFVVNGSFELFVTQRWYIFSSPKGDRSLESILLFVLLASNYYMKTITRELWSNFVSNNIQHCHA